MLLTTPDEIKNTVARIVRSSGAEYPILIAVAYWGEDADLVLPESHQYKLVCNLDSLGTNPKVVRSLALRGEIEIKTNSRLHAKVVIGRSVALLGSANFSNAALGITRDSSLIEAALEITDPTIIENARTWFLQNVWSGSRLITEADLRAAEEAWQQRSPRRQEIKGNKLNESLFLQPKITGGNQIRMASRAIEQVYATQVQQLDKTNVRVPAFVGNLLWVFLGYTVETRFSSGFANLSDVWSRVFDSNAKQPTYLADDILKLLQLIADSSDVGKPVAQLASRYIEEGYPGKPPGVG